MPESDQDRMERLELDPRFAKWTQEIRGVRERVDEAMARLELLEHEVDAYRQEP